MTTKRCLAIFSVIGILMAFVLVWKFRYDRGYHNGSSDAYDNAYSEGYSVGFAEGLTGAPSEENAAFIGNAKSHVYHSRDCGSLPYEENRVYFVDRQSALDNGYHACSHCHP